MEDNLKTINITNKISFPDIPKDIIFPDELNKYLREQVEYLLHENGMVKKHLKDNEIALKKSKATIEDLTLKLKDYDPQNQKQFASTDTIISSKIVELSKKLREKNSEVETLKTKISKLEKKIFEFEEVKIENQKNEQGDQNKINDIDQATEESLVKKLQEKLNIANSKLLETKNSNAQLKNELKIANKCLQDEVGDTLSNISNINSGWRGRAQIICDLQQKNADLREKLKLLGQGKVISEPVKKSEQKIENLSNENANLKIMLEEQKKRNEFLRMRCKALESENVAYKSKITQLNIQADKDKELIHKFGDQLMSQQDHNQESIKQKNKSIKNLQDENDSLRVELSRQTLLLNNLTKEVNEKTEEIRDIAKNNKKSSRSEGSCYQKNISTIEENKNISKLEAERAKLLELTELHSNRISEERNAHSKTQQQLRVERQKAAKLESSLARLELEINSNRGGNSYLQLSSSKSIDMSTYKDELELAQETIKTLKTRLEIEQHERRVDLREFAKILQNSD